MRVSPTWNRCALVDFTTSALSVVTRPCSLPKLRWLWPYSQRLIAESTFSLAIFTDQDSGVL